MSAIDNGGLWRFIQSRERPSGRVANMEDMDDVATDALKYPERIANDRCGADLGALRNAWRRKRCVPDALDDVDKSTSDSFGDRWTGAG